MKLSEITGKIKLQGSQTIRHERHTRSYLKARNAALDVKEDKRSGLTLKYLPLQKKKTVTKTPPLLA